MNYDKTLGHNNSFFNGRRYQQMLRGINTFNNYWGFMRSKRCRLRQRYLLSELPRKRRTAK